MSDKKKILHIVEAFGGGIFSFLTELANYMSEEFEVVILYSKREQTPNDFRKYFNPNIKFIESKYMQRNIGLNDVKALFEIKKIIKQERPDIIHCHSSKAGLIGRIASNTTKYKTFYTPHGYSFLKEYDSKLKRMMYKIIEKIGTLNKSKIIACSKGEYEESLKLTNNVTYVSNGINLKNISKNEFKNIDKDNLKIITTGRISYQKNPMLFDRIAKSFPEIQFIWVGEGELASELTAENINITGWKNKDELFDLLRKSDIFILPSLWEGLPISLLEAMSLKKVCIVSNVIGNRDVIKNEENGFICNNLKEYISVIENIIDEKYNLSTIVDNAYNDILREYNTEVMCEKYMEIYAEKEIK